MPVKQLTNRRPASASRSGREWPAGSSPRQVFIRFSAISRVPLRRRCIARSRLLPPSGYAPMLRACVSRVSLRPSRSPTLCPAEGQRRHAATCQPCNTDPATRQIRRRGSLLPITRTAMTPMAGPSAMTGRSSFRSPLWRSKPSRRFCGTLSTIFSRNRMIRASLRAEQRPWKPVMRRRGSAPI